jgi:hypothetical protein
MSINFRRAAACALAAAGLSVVFCMAVDAAPNNLPSIAINFGSDEPVVTPAGPGSPVNGAAGVLNTVRWNNLTGADSTAPVVLSADVNGTLTPTAATVIWSSPNTWASTGRGEENNTAPAGNNRNLMTGYIDTLGIGAEGASVTIANLPNLASQGLPFFDVYVYIQGGANDRGGTYTIGGSTKEHTVLAPFTGSFIEDTVDPGTTPMSNYLVFRGLTGSGFTLTATPTLPPTGTQRAPVAAIEIVASPVPEPATIALLATSALVVSAGMYVRRRRSQ